MVADTIEQLQQSTTLVQRAEDAFLWEALVVPGHASQLPDGWCSLPFGDFLVRRAEKVGDRDLPLYSATVSGVGLRDKRVKTKSLANNKVVYRGDIVFGLSRDVLNFGLMTERMGSVSPAYEVFRPDVSVVIGEAVEAIMRADMRRYMDVIKPGAREGQGIDRKYLMRKRFPIPPLAVQREFVLMRYEVRSWRTQARALMRMLGVALLMIDSGEGSL